MNLNDICELIVDCPHSTAPDEGEGFPLIRTPNIGKGRLLLDDVHRVSKEVYDDRNKRAVPQENDLILAREAPVGNVAIIKEGQQVCLGQRTVLIRPDVKKVIPEFLVYYLLSPQIQHIFTGSSNGTIVSHLNLAILRKMEVSIPDIETQKEISKHFVAIDDKIDLNNSMISKFEEYIEAVYKQWFVDFNFPDDNGLPYKDNGGQMVIGYGDIEKIPAGWKIVPVLDVVDWVGNSQPPKSTFVYEPQDGYVRFIQNRDYDTDNHITYIPYTKKIKLADTFDILMDKYGDAGKVRYGIAGAPNVALGKIQVDNPNQVEYIRSYFLIKKTYTYLHNTCMASTRASLSKDNLSPLNIVVPNDSVVTKFQTKVRQIREYILFLKKENKKLSDTKEKLLGYMFIENNTESV